MFTTIIKGSARKVDLKDIFLRDHEQFQASWRSSSFCPAELVADNRKNSHQCTHQQAIWGHHRLELAPNNSGNFAARIPKRDKY